MQTSNDGVRRSLAIAAMLLAASACSPDRNDGIAAGDRVAGDTSGAPGADAPADRDSEPVARNDAAPGAFNPAAGDAAETAREAEQLVDEAVMVVNTMQADPEMAALLGQARGIFIIPDYAQAGLGVGGEGGEGIVLLKRASAGGAVAGAADPGAADAGADAGAANADAGAADTEPAGAASAGEWSSPAFYDFGGVTAGAEAGVEIGAIAMLLMTEEAAEVFRAGETDFSLDASAGLTIVDYSARAEAAAGAGDIIVWSDTEGAFVGATVGINGVNRDEDETAAFYGSDVDTGAILSGELMSDRAQPLRDALTG